MPRSKTVTLKGAAAQAFFLSRSGVPPRTEEDAFQSIATRVHMEMSADNLTGAVAILKHMIKHGAMDAAEALVTGN